jgi:hypothetical protein
MSFRDMSGSGRPFGREAGRFRDLPAEGGGDRDRHPRLRMPI